jgi:arylsulfatase A-like enzyme/Flp pilus assembly protein TadD
MGGARPYNFFDPKGAVVRARLGKRGEMKILRRLPLPVTFLFLAAGLVRGSGPADAPKVKGQAFAAEVDPQAKPGALTRDVNTRLSTAEADPQTKPGAPAAAPSTAEPRLNLLLITIDTLRADRLSCYDASHVQTPAIDKLAGSGVLFSRAFAHNPLTLPSHANILLGTTPLVHGVHDNVDFVVREEWLTLAEHLKSFGYATAAFIGSSALDSRFGLNQGFDLYDDEVKPKGAPKYSSGERKAGKVVERALGWIRGKNSPWFAWIHLYDPHAPYDPPEPFLSQHKIQPYDGEVAYVDSALGQLFRFMEDAGVLNKTMVVLTADHGESLGQHGERTHGVFAYNATLWVPLIFHFPGARPARIGQPVCHVDIFPTVCEALNVPAPGSLQGISLLPAMNGKEIPPRKIYFESIEPFTVFHWAPLRGYISEGRKFVESPIPELYDLERDFDERSNLADPKSTASFRAELDLIVKDLSHPENVQARRQPDRQTQEMLKSLGYLAGNGSPAKDKFGPEDDVKSLLPLLQEIEDITYLKDAPTAIRRLREIANRTSKLYQAHLYLAKLLHSTGEKAGAIDVLAEGLQKYPDAYEIFELYCDYLSDAGQFDAVIRIIRSRDLLQMSTNPNIWKFMGDALLKKGDLSGSIAALEKAAAIDDGYADIFKNLGTAYLSQYMNSKNPDTGAKAVRSLKKAVDLDPGQADIYNTLGMAFHQTGDREEAIQAWEKALQIHPNLGKVGFYLGYEYYLKGEMDRARAQLLKYKEANYASMSDEEKKTFDALLNATKR